VTRQSGVVLAALLAAALAPGCALPVVSANTFTPAGELAKGQLDASISLELGHVLADPRDIEVGTPNLPEGAGKWQVSTWIASDLTVRYGLFSRVQLEGQLKLTNPVDPFVPVPVGGAFGVRVLLREKPLGDFGAIAVELGARFVGVRATQELTQTSGDRSQTDRWTYRALGLEVPLVVSRRIHPLVALTAAPFLRAYFIRAWRDTTHPDGATLSSRLEWTPVLSGGLGLAAAFTLGRLELSPALAFELGTRPGVGAATQLLVEPGLSLGVRW
jgi:hypothetical protein